MEKIVELVSYLDFKKNELKELKKQMFVDYNNGKYDESKKDYWNTYNIILGKELQIKDIRKYLTYLKNKEKYSVIETINNNQ